MIFIDYTSLLTKRRCLIEFGQSFRRYLSSTLLIKTRKKIS